jgi:hypothetical protein
VIVNLRTPALLLLLPPLVAARPAAARPPIAEVRIATARVHVADVLPAITGDAGALDLGPAPAPGGSRLVTRDDLRRALAEAHAAIPAALPEAVRVIRKMRRLGALDLERLTRAALPAAMPRGATLTALRAPKSVELADGWDTVTARIPRPPHRVGSFPSTVTLAFLSGGESLAEISFPIDVTVDATGAAFDVARGGQLTLIVKRGLVEIDAPALATTDADLGAIIPVTLRPSGRVVRARLVTVDRAELVDG